MARKLKHTEDEVIRSLSKKNVSISGKVIDLVHAKELGNGSWGKIDYLVNHCNYNLIKNGYGKV
ncbi:hypothetical protein [Tenacibaculum sp.]|uniref:hypothetical protein n=1 Tax=Tenacibaculum sp. TaxID=1906242 RepID=UPI003D117B60